MIITHDYIKYNSSDLSKPLKKRLWANPDSLENPIPINLNGLYQGILSGQSFDYVKDDLVLYRDALYYYFKSEKDYILTKLKYGF